MDEPGVDSTLEIRRPLWNCLPFERVEGGQCRGTSDLVPGAQR